MTSVLKIIGVVNMFSISSKHTYMITTINKGK